MNRAVSIPVDTLQPRLRSQSASPGHSRKAVDLPEQTRSRPSSPSAEQADTKAFAVRGDPGTNPLATPSPTAVPLHFRQPRSSRMPPPTTPATADVTPTSPSPHGTWHKRPISAEFKTDREVRPLFLVERHGSSKIDHLPLDEPYPSLPSSKTTSRASSAEDLRTANASTLADYQFDSPMADYTPRRRSAAPALQIATGNLSRDADNDENMLDSQQTTPTAASFHDEKPQQERQKGEKPKYEFHSPSELLMDPSTAMIAGGVAAKALDSKMGEAQRESQEAPEEIATATPPGDSTPAPYGPRGLEPFHRESPEKPTAGPMEIVEEAAQIPLPAEDPGNVGVDDQDEQTVTAEPIDAENLGPEEDRDPDRYAGTLESAEDPDSSKPAEAETSYGFVESRNADAAEEQGSVFTARQTAKSKKKNKKSKEKGRSVDLGTVERPKSPADEAFEAEQHQGPADAFSSTAKEELESELPAEEKQRTEKSPFESLAEDSHEVARDQSEAEVLEPGSFDVFPTTAKAEHGIIEGEPALDPTPQQMLDAQETSEADFAPVSRKKSKKGKKGKQRAQEQSETALQEAAQAAVPELMTPSGGELRRESVDKAEADLEVQNLALDEKTEEKSLPVDEEPQASSVEPTAGPAKEEETLPSTSVEPAMEEWEEPSAKKSKKKGKKGKKGRTPTISEQEVETIPDASSGPQTLESPPAAEEAMTYDPQGPATAGPVEPESFIEREREPLGSNTMDVDIDSATKEYASNAEAGSAANDKPTYGAVHEETATHEDMWTEPKQSKKQSRKENRKNKKKNLILWDDNAVPTEKVPVEGGDAVMKEADEETQPGMVGEENMTEESVSRNLAVGSDEMELTKEEPLSLSSTENVQEKSSEDQATMGEGEHVTGSVPESALGSHMPAADNKAAEQEEAVYEWPGKPSQTGPAVAEEAETKADDNQSQRKSVSWEDDMQPLEPAEPSPTADEAIEGAVGEPQTATEVPPDEEFELPKSAKAKKKAKKDKKKQDSSISFGHDMPFEKPEESFLPKDAAVEEAGESRTDAEAAPVEEFELPTSAKAKKKAKKARKQRESTVPWEDEPSSVQPGEIVASLTSETQAEQTEDGHDEPQAGAPTITEEFEEPQPAKSKRNAKKEKKKQRQLDLNNERPSMVKEETLDDTPQQPPVALSEESEIPTAGKDDVFEPQLEVSGGDKFADNTALKEAEADEDGKEFQVSKKEKKKNRKKKTAITTGPYDWTDEIPPEQVTENNKERPAVDSSEAAEQERVSKTEDPSASSRLPTGTEEGHNVTAALAPQDSQAVAPEMLDDENKRSDLNVPEGDTDPFQTMTKADEQASLEVEGNVAAEVRLPESPVLHHEDIVQPQLGTSNLGQWDSMSLEPDNKTQSGEAEFTAESQDQREARSDQEKNIEKRLSDPSLKEHSRAQAPAESPDFDDKSLETRHLGEGTAMDVAGHLQENYRDTTATQDEPSGDAQKFAAATAEDEGPAFPKPDNEKDESAPAVESERSRAESTGDDVLMFEAEDQTNESATLKEDSLERKDDEGTTSHEVQQKADTETDKGQPDVAEPPHEVSPPIQIEASEEIDRATASDTQQDVWEEPKTKKKSKKQKKASKAESDVPVTGQAQVEADRDTKVEIGDIPSSKTESKKAKRKKKKGQSLDLGETLRLEGQDDTEQGGSQLPWEKERAKPETSQEEPHVHEEPWPSIEQDTERAEEDATRGDPTSEHQLLSRSGPDDTEGQFSDKDGFAREQTSRDIEEFDQGAKPISQPGKSVVPPDYGDIAAKKYEEDDAETKADIFQRVTPEEKQVTQDDLIEPITQAPEISTAERQLTETAERDEPQIDWPIATKKGKKNKRGKKEKAALQAAPVGNDPFGEEEEEAKAITPEEAPQGSRDLDKPHRNTLEGEPRARELELELESEPGQDVMKRATSKDDHSREIPDDMLKSETPADPTQPDPSGYDDPFQGEPPSLFGGPYGLAEKGYISPPKTPLRTISEHDPTESPSHTRHRDRTDVGSPDRGIKHARHGTPPRAVTADDQGSPSSRLKSRPSTAWDDYGTGRVKEPMSSARPRRRNSSHGLTEANTSRIRSSKSPKSPEPPEPSKPRRLRSAAELVSRKNKDPDQAWHEAIPPPWTSHAAAAVEEPDKDKHPPRTMAADVLVSASSPPC